MNQFLTRFLSVGMALSLALGLSAPTAMAAETAAEAAYPDAVRIVLNDRKTEVNGKEISDAPNAGVFLESGTTIAHYEAKYAAEYGSRYGEAESKSEWHTREECIQESRIVITEPGTYLVSGSLLGQLCVALENTEDAEQTVTLVLDGADITCDVAPAVLIEKAYEFDPTEYEDDGITIDMADAHALDYEAAGARVVLADGSVNHITGSHVAKCYAYTVGEDGELTFLTKDDGSMKKRVKYDGAFYSKVSMTISGEEKGTGLLQITADNEGLCSEQHLVITGGRLQINSQDDGINTNDEGGSVTMLEGGSVTINAGLGAEGDGIDSNGYLIINGGTLFSCAKPISDSGLDADLGVLINGGTVIALGSPMDQVSAASAQPSMMLRFAAEQKADSFLTVRDCDDRVVLSFAPGADSFLKDNARGYGCAILSAPTLRLGESYILCSDDTQLGYVSLSESAVPGGPGDRQPPEGKPPEMPDGTFQPREGGEGDFQPPEKPDGKFIPLADGQPPEPPEGGFGPDGGVTGEPTERRFFVKNVTNVFLGVGPAVDAGTVDPQTVLPFTDVNPVRQAPYYDAIVWACKEGITSGTSPTLFSPKETCTRAQIVTFLWRAAGKPEPKASSCPFVDVLPSKYYYKAVLWACEEGIVKGDTSTTFLPNGICTRKEAVTFLYRYHYSPVIPMRNPFVDVPANAYYTKAVCWSNIEGIAKGTSSTTFAPHDNCTRAQIVTFLYRMLVT